MAIRDEEQFTHTQFAGLRNNVAAGEFELGDLEVALNVEINDNGTIQRRKGYSAPVLSGSYHSLWSGAGVCLAASGGSLYRIEPSVSGFSASTLLTGLAERRISYWALGNRAYWSNGVDKGVVENGACRSWGLEVPPQISATATGGTLRPGRYQFALVYVRSDGQESGAPLSGVLELTSVGGLRFSDLPVSTDPDVSTKILYISKCNGETLYQCVEVANETTAVDFTDDRHSTLPLLTQHLAPPVAGDVISYYNGRTLVASGSILQYSDPYGPELFDRRARIYFESGIGILAPVKGGVFVGTQHETVFLSGEDMAAMSFNVVAQYGVIPGTLARAEADTLGEGNQKGEAWLWASQQGLCAGLDNGAFQNLTQSRFSYPATERGATLVRRHRGFNQAVAVLEGAATAGNTHQ